MNPLETIYIEDKQYIIRLAKLSDRENLFLFHEHNILTRGTMTQEQIEAHHREKQESFPHLLKDDIFEQGFYWLLEDLQKQIVGAIGLTPPILPYMDDNNSLWMTAFSVKEIYRKQRFGTLLYSLAIKEAKKLGFKKIKLTTQSSNKIAIDFYLKNGFRLTKEEEIGSLSFKFYQIELQDTNC